MADLQSRPYKPDPEMCCEGCVFGRGPHALWCENAKPGDLLVGKVVNLVEPARDPEGYACY